MDGTDAGAATLYLPRSAAPNRVPMKAQVLEVLRTKRVNDQMAGQAVAISPPLPTPTARPATDDDLRRATTLGMGSAGLSP